MICAYVFDTCMSLMHPCVTKNTLYFELLQLNSTKMRSCMMGFSNMTTGLGVMKLLLLDVGGTLCHQCTVWQYWIMSNHAV